MARVTLDRLDQKLDDIAKNLVEARTVMAEHIAEDRKMYLTVDRLDQNEQRRRSQLKYLWTAVTAALSGVGLTYFK